MKADIELPGIAIILAVFSLVLIFHFTYNNQGKSVSSRSVAQSAGASQAPPSLPLHLKIPAIKVDAAIEDVGVTPGGAMAVPGNTAQVGWFKLGPRPGEKGSAVIAGHFDGVNGEPEVFYNLYKLKKGDKLYIEESNGTSVTFIVREIRTYNSGYADEVFSSSDSAHLNLVTCDGVWDGVKKSYSKRLVVFADIAKGVNPL
jgi:LPXTG-site transpeptidase (sortase) family protein